MEMVILRSLLGEGDYQLLVDLVDDDLHRCLS